MQDRGHLLTEQRNPCSWEIDRLSIADAFDVMQAEDVAVAHAVSAAKADVCAAIGLVIQAFEQRGRLIYVGAGTSGRLGVLDASECPPTFLSDPSMVVGVMAGGDTALRRSVEGAEDSLDEGARAVAELDVQAPDVVFGITSGGTTPYVHAALKEAKRRGARTVFLACVSREQVADLADVNIRLLVGPEVIAGSTRLKAGTATKMVLNRITTLAMVGIGKVYQNLMVDVNARGSVKLRDRALRILQTVTGLDADSTRALLDRADGGVKIAIAMHRLGMNREDAEKALRQHRYRLRAAFNES